MTSRTSIAQVNDKGKRKQSKKIMSSVDDNMLLEAPACWRRGDILRLWGGHDEESKERLAKYRPFNDQFLEEYGIQLPASASRASERIKFWNWSLPIQGEDARTTGSKHFQERFELFALISIEE